MDPALQHGTVLPQLLCQLLKVRLVRNSFALHAVTGNDLPTPNPSEEGLGVGKLVCWSF